MLLRLSPARALVCCGLLFVVTLGAACQAQTFTDPEKAGKDFGIQGEYQGVFKNDEEEAKTGAQVIALGEGKFDLVGYMGGLPGDGWKKSDETERGSGQLEGETVTFRPSEGTWKAELTGGVLTVFEQDKAIGELKKVERKSDTLGAKPPEGAIVLFDGTNVDEWDNGKIIEENLLGATNCSTKRKFGDHVLHIEFRTPFMPTARGQGRGNSGVYIQSRYELQVLDSFGLEGANNECGGIYSISEPAVNMCLPPLSWQTYDIDFTAARYDDDGNKVKNARATIKHNGVVIHDDLELDHGTPGRSEEGPGPDALFLQDHGNPVAVRNIWVVEKKE